MFPHTITIYTHSVKDGQDSYTKRTLDGFYWSKKKIRSKDGRGSDDSADIVAISNLSRTQEFYSGQWTVNVGDIITQGKGGDISTVKELNEPHRVVSVDVNICGSAVDNIAIGAK